MPQKHEEILQTVQCNIPAGCLAEVKPLWHALAELGKPCSSLQGKADVHPHTEWGGDCCAAEPSPATPTCVKQCGWLSSQMQIRSEYKLEEINIGRELLSISFISSEIAAIVNSLT